MTSKRKDYVASQSSTSTNESNLESSSGDNQLFFQKSSQQISHDGSDSILDLAEEAGIDIPSSCRQGSCGTCKVLKIEGDVIMETTEDILSDDEIEDGYILACCSIAKGKVVIDA